MIRRFLLPCFAIACTDAAPGSLAVEDDVGTVSPADGADVTSTDVNAGTDLATDDDVAPDAPSCSPLEALPGLEAGPITGAAVLGERLYASTRDSLYVSDDGGASFTQVLPSSGLQGDIERLQSWDGALYVSAGTRVFRSTDGDVFVDTGLPDSYAVPTLSASGGLVVAIHATRPYRYDDVAAAFVPLFEGEAPLAALSCVATDGKTFLGDGLNTGGVVRSNDGKTWAQVDALPGWGYQAAFVDGPLLLAANPEELSRSTDGGATWEKVESPGLGAVSRLERALPSSGPAGSEPLLFAWTANGLFESSDDGATWSPSGDTLRAQFGEVLTVQNRTVVRDGAGLSVIQGAEPVALTVAGGLVAPVLEHDGIIVIQDANARVRHFRDGAWSAASDAAFIGLASVAGQLLGYFDRTVFSGSDALAFDPVGTFDTYESIGRVFATETHLFVSSGPWMGDSCGGKGPSALESGGLFRWDGDDQWTQAVSGMPVTQKSCSWGSRYPEPRALIDTGDALLVATVKHGAFRSTNDGDDWSPVIGLPVDAAQVLFATDGGHTIAVDAATATLYREALPGHFEELGPVTGLSPTARVTSVALASKTLLVGITDAARRAAAQGLWVSNDDGATFTRVDVHGAGVAFFAVAGDTVFLGTAGAGAFRVSVAALEGGASGQADESACSRTGSAPNP